MRALARWFGLGMVALVGCNGELETDTDVEDTNDGACGAVTNHDVTVTGKVVAAGSGQAVDGATVRLEERGWNTQVATYGTATTDAQGLFTLDASQIVSVERCWAMLDYVLVAESGAQSGESEVNTPLFNAIEDGSGEADVSSFPIEIE